MTELKKKADRFVLKVWARNVTEWLACAFVVVMFARLALDRAGFHWVSRLGAALTALAALYIGYRLYRDGRLRRLPDPAQDTHAYIEAYRGQLLSQADLIHRVPRWYIAPFLPGFVLYYAGSVLKHPEQAVLMVALFLGTMAFFALVALVNRRGAAKLRRQADALVENGA